MLERFDFVKKYLDEVRASGFISEIGNQADLAAMKLVFPAAQRKPFLIVSFANLNKFIDDPNKATESSLCYSEAFAAWVAMDKNQRDLIAQKRNELIKQFPNLVFFINMLKNNWPVAHTFTSVEDAIEHYRSVSDEGMVAAMETCSKLLKESEKTTTID